VSSLPPLAMVPGRRTSTFARGHADIRGGTKFRDGDLHRSVACIPMIPTHQINYRLIEEWKTSHLLLQCIAAGLGVESEALLFGKIYNHVFASKNNYRDFATMSTTSSKSDSATFGHFFHWGRTMRITTRFSSGEVSPAPDLVELVFKAPQSSAAMPSFQHYLPLW